MTVAVVSMLAALVLSFLGVPVGFAMVIVGAAGFAAIRGMEPALTMVAQQVIDNSANYGLSVLPMFVLMGVFVVRADIAEELYDTANAWLGHLKGGLAHATVASCALFGAISGSSIAAAATMSKVAIPPMRRLGYHDRLSTGCVASAGVLAVLIPPSVPLILYGILVDQDIRLLFIATIGPGIVQTLLFMGAVSLTMFKNPELGPRGPKRSLAEKLTSLKGTWAVLVLFVGVMGGMYSGVFTTTESAAIGAAGAFFIALARRRLSWETFIESLVEAARMTAMIFVILFGAMIFANFVALSGMTDALVARIQEMKLSATGVLIAMAVIYFAFSCLMESIGLMILTVPVFAGIVQPMGVNLIWFGVFVTMMIEIGMLTPPLGMNVFTVKTVVPEVPLRTIFIGVLPFLAANLVGVALLVAWPPLAMSLVRLLK